MRKSLTLPLIVIASYGLMAQTIFGFNQTHTANQLTDNKCKVIPAAVNRIIKEIDAEKRASIRFPGGTVANEFNVNIYGHTLAEAKSSKWQKNKINPIVPFIEASKMIGWSVIPVINVTDIYNGKVSFDEGMSLNLKMIDMFVRSGVKVSHVEIGNELNIWMNIRGNKDYNRNPKEYDVEIQKYYDLCLKADKLIKAAFPGVKTGGVSARFGYNARDNKWCSLFDYGTWDAIIIHHYEDVGDKSIWEKNIAEMVAQAKACKKELWITELNVRLGPSVGSLAYKRNASQSWITDYQTEIWDICKRLKVDLMCYHRITGTDDHSYNYLKF